MIGTVVPPTANISIGDVTPFMNVSLSTLVRIQPPDFEKLADAWWFTLLAYISAFLPWALVETTDFISEEWRSVKRTRQVGHWVLGFTVTPMLYILAYCVVQGIAKDYKELWAALVALIFAFLALLRTLWGLWQLFTFQTWVRNSVQNLEALGIECELPQKRKRSGLPNVDNDDSSDIDKSVKISESILVNNTIIDNQLTHGSTCCFLRFRDYDLFHKGKGDDNDNGRYTVLKAVIEFLKVLFLILVNVILSTIGLQKLEPIRQVPKEPVEIWMRWGAAFSSQVLHSWLSEYNFLADAAQEEKKEDQSSWQRWKKAGRYFSSEVVASASMQLLSANGQKAFSNPFLWNCWLPESDMRDGRIRKSELLDIAVESGRALPFEAKQREALENLIEPNLRHLTRSSYASYEYLLLNYIEQLPLNSTISKLREKLTSETLEWLAVLLHFGYLAKTESASSTETDISTSDQQTSKNVSSDSTVSKGAVRNLSQQVGMSDDFGYVETVTENGIVLVGDLMTKLVPIPSLPDSISVPSEGNRLVSKAGQLIDVWLALVSGSQLSCYSTHLNPTIKKKCLAAVAHGDSTSEVYDANVELEKDRLEKRLVYGEGRHDQMDHFVTFMGYRMESVRSCLVKRSDEVDTNCSIFFTPKVAFSIQVPVTKRLKSLMMKRHLWGSRAVQCQMIWELQNEMEKVAFQSVGLTGRDSEDCSSEPKNRTSKHDVDKGATAMAILCILSFPSLSVGISAEEAGGISTVRIRAEFGPQCLLVRAQFGGGESCHLQILNGSTDSPSLSTVFFDFKWAAWRDAFSGRLHGFSRWQKSIGINPADLFIGGHAKEHGLELKIRTENGGMIPNVLIWLPFRLFCRYELESEGLLRQHSISRKHELTSTGTIWKIPILSTEIRKLNPVGYGVARDETLMEGALFIQQAVSGTEGKTTDPLNFAKELKKRDRWQSLLFYGAVSLQARDVTDVALQSCLETCQKLNTNSAMQEALYVVESYCGQRITGRLLVKDVTTEVLEALIRFLEHCLRYGSFDEGSIQLQRKCCEFIQFLATYNLNGKREKWMSYLYRLIYLMEPMEPSYTGIRAIEAFVSIREVIEKFEREDHGASKSMEDQMGCQAKGVPAKVSKSEKILTSISQQIESKPEYFQALYAQVVFQIAYVLQWDGIVKIVRDSYSRRKCETVRPKFETVKYTKHVAKTILTTYSREQRNTICLFVDLLTNRTPHAFTSSSSETLGPSENFGMQMSRQILEWIILNQKGTWAMATLAALLWEDKSDVEANEKRAVKLYEEAIRKGGHVHAMYNLAKLLHKGGEKVEPDEKRAVRLYEEAIRKGGHVGAMYNLGILLSQGKGEVKMNEKRAVELYERAIREGGHVSAMNNLGKLFEKGKQIEGNKKRAVELYERAILEGEDVNAMINLGNLLCQGGTQVEVDEKRAVQLYERAICKGDVRAMYNLAILLCQGKGEVKMNEKRAVQLYERAIQSRESAIREGVYIGAMFNLANLLRAGGNEIRANEKRAVELYERAIDESGHVGAMINLANLLRDGGNEVEANEKRAVELYERAICEGGGDDARNNLAKLLGERGVDVKLNVD